MFRTILFPQIRMKNLCNIAHMSWLSTGDGLRQKNGERFKIFGGQSILRFGALCDKHLEKRGHSFLQTAAPIQATGGVTPVATPYQNSVGLTSL
jgi:hypothetical protein